MIKKSQTERDISPDDVVARSVMFSTLCHFDLIDAQGQRAKLIDCAIALLEEDYPPVTRIFFQHARQKHQSLPWASVLAVDWQAKQIRVADLKLGQEVSTAASEGEVWLKRDVQDALVLDLQNRRATRANDLWLAEGQGQLRLRAADTSLRAILRRLSHGRLGQVRKSALYDWKYVEFLRGDPQAVRNGAGYHLRITRLPPGEIALLSASLPYLHAAELLTLLPDPIAADTLEAMTLERQLQVFEELGEDQGSRLLELMAPDNAADLIGRLNADVARRYLNLLSAQQSKRIVELLRYPEDTVGGMMTNDVVFVPSTLTVGTARELLRERLKKPDFAYMVYLVESEETRRLRGVITLRELLVAGDEEKLEEIMNPYVLALHPLDPATAAAYRVINNHLAALPVVGGEGQLVGVVTVDAAVAQVAPASWSAQSPKVFS